MNSRPPEGNTPARYIPAIRCAKCQRAVDSWYRVNEQTTNKRYIRVRCHGRQTDIEFASSPSQIVTVFDEPGQAPADEEKPAPPLGSLKTQLDQTSDYIASATVIAKALVDVRQKVKAMAGGKFFALLDEEQAGDELLDKLADDLNAARAKLIDRAKAAVETKHDRIKAGWDYLDRLEGKVKAIEESNQKTNGGPTVEGSGPSPAPSEPTTDSKN